MPKIDNITKTNNNKRIIFCKLNGLYREGEYGAEGVDGTTLDILDAEDLLTLTAFGDVSWFMIIIYIYYIIQNLINGIQVTKLLQMSNTNLYTLRLSDGCFFIYAVSEKDDVTHNHVCETCIQKYEYVRKHQPAEVVHVRFSIDPIQIDRYVLQKILDVGIECVRGGTYWQDVLPDFLMKSIDCQIKTATYDYNNASIDELSPSIYDNYIEFKYFKYQEKTYIMNREYLRNELSWLFDHIDTVIHNNKYGIQELDLSLKDSIRVSKEMKSRNHDKYKTLLIYLREIPKLYLKTIRETGEEIQPDFYSSDIHVYYDNPEFILDSYIYHYKTHAHRLEPNRALITKYQESIMDMYYTVVNYISEIEFAYFNLN